MKKKIFLIFCLSLVSLKGIIAENAADNTAPEKAIGYNIALDVANTYSWRGYDVYYPKMEAAGNPTDVFNFVPGLFPSITLSFPAGLSFNIWSAWALTSRESASGDLRSADEVDLTAAYEIEDKSGTFTALLAVYVYPTEGSLGTLPSYPELVASYTAPWDILNPSLTIAAAFGPEAYQYQYASVSVSHEFEFDALTIGPELIFGYWINDGKNHFDVNLPFTFSINENFEVHAGVIGCYRITGFDGSPFILMANLGTSFSF